MPTTIRFPPLSNIRATKSALGPLFSNAPTEYLPPINIPASSADFSVWLD